MWIFVVILLLRGVTEVSADQTKTALIAAGCIAGGLLVSAAAIGAILCFIRHRRRVEKQPLPKYHDGVTMTNGTYRPDRFIRRSSTFSGTSGNSQQSDIRDQRRSLRAKTFTQNAQSPRQRPPVLFYTIRADPRLYPEVQMGLPVYSRPPQVGRPVFFLERSGNSKSKPHNVDFMYPNSGTMLYLANGSAGITTASTNENWARKDRPRSKSFSRSRGPEIFTRRHSDTSETSLIGAPGDIILRQKMETTNMHSKTTNSSRHDDNNNNTNFSKTHSASNGLDSGSVNFVNHTTNIKGYLNNKNKYLPGERYSLTQLQTSNNVYPALNKPLGANHFLFKERGGTVDFGDDDESILSTPRKDYPNDTPKTTGILRLSQKESTEIRPDINKFTLAVTDTHGTPRADYGPEIAAHIDYSERFIINVKEIEDIIAMSEQSTKYTSEKENRKEENDMAIYRQKANLDRPASPPTIARPVSPPFDGVELMLPSKISVPSIGESSSSGDLGSSQPSEWAHPNFHLQVPPPFPPPPPPPPPLPVENGKQRPPTPRTELIRQDDISGSDERRDIVRKSSTEKEFPEIKTATENQTKLGQLPFMEELKRRQRSIDEGVSLLPPTLTPTSQPSQEDSLNISLRRNSGKDNSSVHNGDLSNSKPSRHGLPQRPSVVQFADDPPEIIPREDEYSIPRFEDDESQMDLGTNTFFISPAPPPPPPPPLPPHF